MSGPSQVKFSERIHRLVTSERNREDDDEHRLAQERNRSIRDFFRQRGRRYDKCRFATFAPHGSDEHQSRQKAAVKKLASWDVAAAIESGQNLVIYGPVGTGKDHLMVSAMLKMLCCAEIPCERYGEPSTRAVNPLWANGADLFGRMRDSFDATSEAEFLQPYIDADILCVSDPVPSGADKLTDFQAATLYRILDRRYNAMRPVWVSMNISNASDFDRRLSPQIADRLRDGALVVKCDWPSYRKSSGA